MTTVILRRMNGSTTIAALSHRRGDYGFDAPYVPVVLGGGALALFPLAAIKRSAASVYPALGGLWFLLNAASYLYTTRVGKFSAWAKVLNGLNFSGAERLLDLGCGRGAVLLMAAKLVPDGKAVGADLWRSSDQSGNSMEATRRNAELEGVADRVELVTADMRALPFTDGSFDLVLSSLAIHNIHNAEGRIKAIDEAVRVLKPGGRLQIADFRHTGEYRSRMRQLGMSEVKEQSLGWRFWYGGPWATTRLVSATKPT